MLVRITPVNLVFSLKPVDYADRMDIISHLSRYNVHSDGTSYSDNLGDLVELFDLSDGDVENLQSGYPLEKDIDAWTYYHGIVGYCSD